jgi:4-amino-4-deoxy-L-arabinose transferase-like glycosyltransferase
MASSVPLFYGDVVLIIRVTVLVFSLVVQAVALVHCVTQRSDAFPAIGTLPKGGWLAIIGVCLGLTLLLRDPIGIFSLVGIAAAAIYLLDVRSGLRDLTDGKGFW